MVWSTCGQSVPRCEAVRSVLAGQVHRCGDWLAGLENRRGSDVTVGSNPTASAQVDVRAGQSGCPKLRGTRSVVSCLTLRGRCPGRGQRVAAMHGPDSAVLGGTQSPSPSRPKQAAVGGCPGIREVRAEHGYEHRRDGHGTSRLPGPALEAALLVRQPVVSPTGPNLWTAFGEHEFAPCVRVVVVGELAGHLAQGGDFGRPHCGVGGGGGEDSA